MNSFVALFFLHTTLATFLLGFKFRSRADQVFKNFGLALILNGFAFVVWSVAVLMKPDNLEAWVTVGVIFFAAALVYFLAAGTQHVDPATRQSIMIAGVVGAVILFFLRTFVYPSQPGFSPEGLFFFNPHPIVQALYIFGISLTALPAINALASKFGKIHYAHLVQYGFTALVVGSVILVSSVNTTLLYLNGWVMGIVYLVLWTSLVLHSKAWAQVS